MKNLTITIEADNDMTQLGIQISRKELANVEYSFILYQLLLELYKRDKDDVLVAINAFLDKLEERGEI